MCFPASADFVHCGCVLKDDLTLDSYGIKSGSTLHIIKKTWPEPEVKPGASGALREILTCEEEAHLISVCPHRAGEQVCCRQRVPDASGRAALQHHVQRGGTHSIHLFTPQNIVKT